MAGITRISSPFFSPFYLGFILVPQHPTVCNRQTHTRGATPQRVGWLLHAQLHSLAFAHKRKKIIDVDSMIFIRSIEKHHRHTENR